MQDLKEVLSVLLSNEFLTIGGIVGGGVVIVFTLLSLLRKVAESYVIHHEDRILRLFVAEDHSLKYLAVTILVLVLTLFTATLFIGTVLLMMKFG